LLSLALFGFFKPSPLCLSFFETANERLYEAEISISNPTAKLPEPEATLRPLTEGGS